MMQLFLLFYCIDTSCPTDQVKADGSLTAVYSKIGHFFQNQTKDGESGRREQHYPLIKPELRGGYFYLNLPLPKNNTSPVCKNKH